MKELLVADKADVLVADDQVGNGNINCDAEQNQPAPESTVRYIVRDFRWLAILQQADEHAADHGQSGSGAIKYEQPEVEWGSPGKKTMRCVDQREDKKSRCYPTQQNLTRFPIALPSHVRDKAAEQSRHSDRDFVKRVVLDADFRQCGKHREIANGKKWQRCSACDQHSLVEMCYAFKYQII